jgi:hypothetical protein
MYMHIYIYCKLFCIYKLINNLSYFVVVMASNVETQIKTHYLLSSYISLSYVEEHPHGDYTIYI